MIAARTLSSYFKLSATATINFVADEFTTRIETSDGWYIEPPPALSLMDAVRSIRLWAGDQYEVAVIEDLENELLSPVPMKRRESRREDPRKVVEQARRAEAPDKASDAARRIRRCA